MFNFAQEEEVEDKLYEDLAAASNILYERIIKDRHFEHRKAYIKDHMADFVKKGYV